jgi:serine/threonine protein kinase
MTPSPLPARPLHSSSDAPPFVGRYRLVDQIGAGGMAVVHLARWDGVGNIQKWFAIKRILPRLVKDDHVIKMFLDEARIVASINHPNVTQVFDLGSEGGQYWIAMEYLHGEPVRELLQHVMDHEITLAPGVAARIVADAAAGLHAAHELRGKDGQPLHLVHRDVSPRNLFLTYDGMVKVMDFGVADALGRLAVTEGDMLKGSIPYMSPERLTGLRADRTADIFALGIVLWELTTGRRLFLGNTHAATIDRVVACEVPPPTTFVPGYPSELEAIVMRALSRDPSRRYPTARDLSRALERYLMTSGQLIGPEELSAYSSEVFRDRIKERDEHLRWAAEVTRSWEVNARNDGARGREDAVDVAPRLVTAQEVEAATLVRVPVDRRLAPAAPLAGVDSHRRKTR